jgi:ribose 1,5-bisphosphokinase
LRGTLFLVVGPSGAGKDTLMLAAQNELEADEHFIFPKRIVTRDANADEDNHVVDLASFDAQERAGAFALSWRAHGNAYGVPRSIEACLERGEHVVINVSREVVAAARAKFAPCKVILVTAKPDVLAARLKARGRESDAAIVDRLSRERAVEADATVDNSGTEAAGAALFIATLRG